MDSSQSIAVKLKPTATGATPTNTPTPVAVMAPTPTTVVATPSPTAKVIRVTVTPRPTLKPTPTRWIVTTTPIPTYTPRPTVGPTTNRALLDATLSYTKGMKYYRDGMYDQAISELTVYINNPIPKSSGAYKYRGLAYQKLGQFQRAIQDYDQAIRRHSGRPQIRYAPVYYNRGRAYRQLGLDTEADADKAKACSLDKQYC